MALGRNLETARKEIILVRLRKSDIEVTQAQVAWPHGRKSASRQFTRLFCSIAKQLDVCLWAHLWDRQKVSAFATVLVLGFELGMVNLSQPFIYSFI